MESLELPEEAGRDYQTVAGFVVSQLAHVPAEGEIFEWKGWRFEIIDMDRHRVDKVLAIPWKKATGAVAGGNREAA